MAYHTTEGEEETSESGHLCYLWDWEVIYLSGRSASTFAHLALYMQPYQVYLRITALLSTELQGY